VSEAERQGGTIGCRADIAPTRLGIRSSNAPHRGNHFGQGDGLREWLDFVIQSVPAGALTG
jgi:hypothetical protein